MTDFKAVMRRIITGDDADGQSVIILDGGPSASAGDPDVGGLCVDGREKILEKRDIASRCDADEQEGTCRFGIGDAVVLDEAVVPDRDGAIPLPNHRSPIRQHQEGTQLHGTGARGYWSTRRQVPPS